MKTNDSVGIPLVFLYIIAITINRTPEVAYITGSYLSTLTLTYWTSFLSIAFHLVFIDILRVSNRIKILVYYIVLAIIELPIVEVEYCLI